MSAYPEQGRSAFRHVAAIYDSDRAFLKLVSSFLLDGVASGEATLAALGPDHTRLLREALPKDTDVTFLDAGTHNAQPASAIRALQEVFAAQMADGADAIRIVGEAPNSAKGTAWEGWAGYEAVINRAYETFPLRKLCAYDRRVTSREVLHDVERTHPSFVTAADGHRPSDRYEAPEAFLTRRPPSRPEDVEHGPADVELVDPLPATARRGLADLCRRGGVTADATDDLKIAVNEIVTNATLYGKAPVTLRAWVAPERVVVTVHDCGPGPSDPFAGLLPAAGDGGEGGYGLWIAHQLLPRVTMDREFGGFTVRLVAGRVQGSEV